MSGYKPGYSEKRSPSWEEGRRDGKRDRNRMGRGKEPIGPMPPDPDHPVMYNRGYESAFQGL